MTVGLARQRAGHAVTLTFVNHSLVRDLGVLGVGRNSEHHELPEIEAGGALKPFGNPGGRTDESEINVLGGAGSFDAELHNETALNHRAVSEFGGDAREKAVEDEELPPACEVDAADRCGAKPILPACLKAAAVA